MNVFGFVFITVAVLVGCWTVRDNNKLVARVGEWLSR